MLKTDSFIMPIKYQKFRDKFLCDFLGFFPKCFYVFFPKMFFRIFLESSWKNFPIFFELNFIVVPFVVLCLLFLYMFTLFISKFLPEFRKRKNGAPTVTNHNVIAHCPPIGSHIPADTRSSGAPSGYNPIVIGGIILQADNIVSATAKNKKLRHHDQRSFSDNVNWKR